MKITLKEFFDELGALSYDNGDYAVIRNRFRDNEIKSFIDCFLPGTEIISDGKNGKPLLLKGAANTDKGAAGKEEIELTGYHLYDYSDADGNWVLISFQDLNTLEKHLLSPAGYLNFYSTQMFVFKDGIEQPFEIMFHGDNDTVISIDKDQMDTPFELEKLQDKISVRWKSPEELLPLSDEDVAAYRESLGKK